MAWTPRVFEQAKKAKGGDSSKRKAAGGGKSRKAPAGPLSPPVRQPESGPSTEASIVINRAPVLTLWVALVAYRKTKDWPVRSQEGLDTVMGAVDGCTQAIQGILAVGSMSLLLAFLLTGHHCHLLLLPTTSTR